jgi:Cu(I)/Ag(I) efflux system membrane fusion protein
MRRIALPLMAAGLFAAFAAGWYLRSAPVELGAADAQTAAARAAPREVLFYPNPMGLADVSPVPKKDSMGMDYVAVYADEVADSVGTVVLDPQKIQRLGVRTATVARQALVRSVRASARIEVDESRLHTIAPKFAGWVERLYANETGMAVRRGDLLAEIYSPELVSAQEEYLIARAALERLGEPGAQRGMRELADAAFARLRNWDIPVGELRALRQGRVERTLALASPVDAVVLGKRATEGMRFMAGDTLFELADLSEVWLIAETGSLEFAAIAAGQELRFTAPALPGRVFEGRVSFIYPTLSEVTRTLRFRATLPNPHGLLRPALLGEAEISGGDTVLRTVVPNSAVIDSGARRTVLVAYPGGRFEAREVRLGQRGEDLVEVLDGVREGEEVVVSANFLIDSESNLKAALQGFDREDPRASAPPQSAAHEGH